MTKNRLEGFSDGILAIIITIMVLELKIPKTDSWEGLMRLMPGLLSYLLSFIVLATFWVNHHHLLHTLNHVTSRILWSNFHLIFWLSLIPFGTAWMGNNDFHPNTVALYAFLLLACSIAYNLLLFIIEACFPDDSVLLVILKKQLKKGIFSCCLFALAIPAAFVNAYISGALFLAVMVLWFIPDQQIERSLK